VNGQLLTAKDLLKLKSLLSCEGHPLPLHVARSGAQLVAKARILHADIRCANGLLDLVDTVLVPPGVTLPPPAPPAPPAPVVTTTSTSDVSTNEATDDASPDMDASTNASAPAPASAPSTNDIPVAPIAH
jgi:hypothetical protein